MTPLPKRKLSKQRQGKRRFTIRLSLGSLIICKNCGTRIKSHTVCNNCGYYNNRSVKKVKEPKAKKSSK